MSNDNARFGERISSKNTGPRSPMKKPSDWRNPPDPWRAPLPTASNHEREKGASLTAAATPQRFASPRKTNTAPVAVEDTQTDYMSAGAARYQLICKRLYALPDPTYMALLNGDEEVRPGDYSTARAQVALDPDGIFAIVSTLELCRGLHTLRLTGLQRGGKPLLRKATLTAAVAALRSMASVRLLDLSRNMLDDEIAAQPLQKLLTNNASLTSLSLRANELSTATARAILSTVPTNRTLLELDMSENVELRWPGQAGEYAKLLKENTSINSFGASLRPEPIDSVLAACNSHPSRMRRLSLTMLPLSEKQHAVLCGWLVNKQVHPSPARVPLSTRAALSVLHSPLCCTPTSNSG